MSGSNSTTPTSESSTPIPTTPTDITTSSSLLTTSSSTEFTTSSTTSSETSTSSSATTTPTPSVLTSVVTLTPTEPGQSLSIVIITSTETPTEPTTASSRSSSNSASRTSSSSKPTANGGSGGLTGGGKIAVAVVVPIVAVALLILAGLFLWRKRKQRKDAEELRRKEVEEYGYNPNKDPTLPAVGVVGSAGNDGVYEMAEDGSTGYRGWGTTAVASSGRKASTTISGPSAGGIGVAYSDTSPGHGAISDTRSDNPIMDNGAMSPESEVLGAMGPSASDNRGGVNRGPSNASSSYSAANRSDASGDGPGAYGGNYGNQYDTGNPYTDTPYGSPPNRAEMSGQPVIRDVQARRNTRIENPSHFPQQSAGISQNF